MLVSLKKVIFFLFFNLFYNPLFAQLDLTWEHRLSKSGIEVFTSEPKNSNFKAAKANTIFSTNYTGLINFLTSTEKHVKYIPNCIYSKLLKNESDTAYYFYQQFDMPWPVADRDIAFVFYVRRDSIAKSFSVKTYGLPTYLPIKKEFIRVPNFKAQWQASYVGNKKVNATYAAAANPGGLMPAWFVNMFIVDSPYQSFYKMKKYFETNEK